MKVYLENGNAIKTAWDGSIALSAYPTAGIGLPYALTVEKYSEAGGDFAGETLSITPVVFANKYFVVKNNAGTIQTTHYFNSFTADKEGDYRLIYDKDGSGVVTVTIFYGKDGKDVAYSSVQNPATIVFELNTGISNSTHFEGYITYQRNVICIGTQTVLALGAAEKARCLLPAATPLYTLAGNEVRFYVKEKGSYKILDDTSPATKEVSKANLLCDSLITKTNIITLVKDQNDLAVYIQRETALPIKVYAGQVENKATWLKTVAGYSTMFNDIHGWL